MAGTVYAINVFTTLVSVAIPKSVKTIGTNSELLNVIALGYKLKNIFSKIT